LQIDELEEAHKRWSFRWRTPIVTCHLLGATVALPFALDCHLNPPNHVHKFSQIVVDNLHGVCVLFVVVSGDWGRGRRFVGLSARAGRRAQGRTW